jgi:tRNA G18 (ribose-2'-O)-methylase SpoU
MGAKRLYLTGYTPYPIATNDKRLPHESAKLERQIEKTALGTISKLNWEHIEDVTTLLARLQDSGYELAALEQTPDAIPLPDYRPPKKIALLLGNETEGVDPKILEILRVHLSIPMLGSKESFNVVQAAAMALYHLQFSR